MIYQNEINGIIHEIATTFEDGTSTSKYLVTKTSRGLILIERLQRLASDWILSGRTAEERRITARWLYWFSEYVDASILYQALGLPHTHALIAAVGPYHFKLKCTNCGGLKETFYVSRAKRKEGHYGPSGVTLLNKDRGLCDGCIATKSAREKQESNKSRGTELENDLKIIREEVKVSVDKRYRALCRVMAQSSWSAQLKVMPYKEFLTTFYWDIVRQYKLKQASYKCDLCNTSKSLHVHHKTYEHRGEEYQHLSDLTVLCSNCHAKFHDKLPK